MKNIYAMAAKQSQGSFKPQRERDILVSVTLSILVVYEVSRLRKDGRKDLDHSGKVCTRNMIDTKTSCRIILSRRQRKCSKT
jgi:hypothetical protein